VLDFTGNGSTDYFTAPSSNIFDCPDGDWCWIIWTRFDSLAGSAFNYLISSGAVGGNNVTNIYFPEASSGDDPAAGIRMAFDSAIPDVHTTADFDANQTPWLIVAGRKSNTLGIRVAQPGATAVIGPTTTAVPSGSQGTPGTWYFGSRSDLQSARFFKNHAGEFFRGDFYPSDAEIVAMANGLHPLALGKPFTFWWPAYGDTGGNQIAPIGGSVLTRNGTPGTSRHAPITLGGATAVTRSSAGPATGTIAHVAPSAVQALAAALRVPGATAHRAPAAVQALAGHMVPSGATAHVAPSALQAIAAFLATKATGLTFTQLGPHALPSKPWGPFTGKEIAVTGSIGHVAPALVQAIAAAERFAGTAAHVAPAARQAADGLLIPSGTAAHVAPAALQAVTGGSGQFGFAAHLAPAAIAALDAAERLAGAVAQLAPPAVQAMVAAETVAGAVAQLAPALVQAIAGTLTITGEAAHVLAAAIAAITGAQASDLAGTVVHVAPSAVAALAGALPVTTVGGTFIVGADGRTVTVAPRGAHVVAPRRSFTVY
jgi:hypothetical protein